MSQEICTKRTDDDGGVEICCPCKAGELLAGIVQRARHDQIGAIFQIDFDDRTELEIAIGDKLFRFTITDATGDYPDRSGGDAPSEAPSAFDPADLFVGRRW